MALRDTLSGVLDKVRGIFAREPKAMDAFGGDELFDGEDDGESQGSSNLGSKIAFGISGVMLLSLIGLVGFVIFSSDESAEQTGGSLAGLELEEDPSAAPDSAERRPWLTPTGQAGGRRLGMSEDPKTAENAAGKVSALPTREVAKAEPMKPPPAGQDTQAAKKPEPVKTETPKPAETKVAEAAKPGPVKAEPVKTEPAKAEPAKVEPVKTTAAPAAVTPAAAPAATAKPEPAKPGETKVAEAKPAAMPAASALPVPEDDEEASAETPKDEQAMPSLMAAAPTAPGAPRRIDSGDSAAAVAGGKPRLNDPMLPPVDRTSIGAPPPRFAALAPIKLDAPAAPTAKVAIVVEGLGLNRAATEAALTKLPPSVTLAFSPYARDLKRLMDRAKQRGHEVLIEVPMESKAFPADDPGPLGLLTSLETKDNVERLDTILKEATGAVGVFDGMGSKFRESQSHIGEVLGKLKAQNLFYVQGRPGIRVGDTEVPSATTDVVIDEKPFRAALDARFDYAERLAKYQGSSVAVMTARPISFERLALWAEQLPKKGVALTPVSQVLVQ
jgi:polysaccharide deacetylase 2 family uncharacterized protein YibQ